MADRHGVPSDRRSPSAVPDHRQKAVRVVAPVAVQVEVEAEIVGVGEQAVGDNEDRRARVIEQVGDVLLRFGGGEARCRLGLVIVIDVEGTADAVGEPAGVDVIGGDQQAVIELVGGGQDGGEQLGLGAFEGRVGGEPGDGLVGLGHHGALLAAADHQEGDRHEGDDGEQEQGDDEGDAALRSVKRGAWSVRREA